MATAQRGSRITLGDGTEGVIVQSVSYLDGTRWRVRFKGGEVSEYKFHIHHESAFATITDPYTYEVGDQVRIGPAGPNGEVTAVVSGDPTLYEVEWETVTKASGMVRTHTADFEAWQLVGVGEV